MTDHDQKDTDEPEQCAKDEKKLSGNPKTVTRVTQEKGNRVQQQ